MALPSNQGVSVLSQKPKLGKLGPQQPLQINTVTTNTWAKATVSSKAGLNAHLERTVDLDECKLRLNMRLRMHLECDLGCKIQP